MSGAALLAALLLAGGAHAQAGGLPPAVADQIKAAAEQGDANALNMIAQANPTLALEIAGALVKFAVERQATDPALAAIAAMVALDILKGVPPGPADPLVAEAMRVVNTNPYTLGSIGVVNSERRVRRAEPNRTQGGGSSTSGGDGGSGLAGTTSEVPNQFYGSAN
ncbi:MAG: hypothetical protein IPK81_08285 [Rhodospirillales bacterium]|nr:MAG: hypothetical protein IPK81_08285 [Rhodospirillales bacterium]